MATYYKYSVMDIEESISTHYKKGDIEFDYISPKEFKKIEKKEKPTIIGSIKIKETNKKNCDVISIKSHGKEINFELLEKTEKVKGYVKVDDNAYVSIEKKSLLFILLLIILIGLLLVSFKVITKYELFGIGSSNSNSNVTVNNQGVDLEFEEGEDIKENSNSTEEKVEQESIAIPGYVNVQISDTKPEVSLSNPKGNTVYMKYTLKEGNKVIYTTKAFAPGKMVKVNLKKLLSVGEHTITFIIETYDIETQAPCNGAVQEVKVIVK